MTAIGEAVSRIPQAWRVVMTIAAILSIGFGAGVLFFATASDLKGLPSRMDAVEESVDSLRQTDLRTDSKLNRLICYAESQAGVRHVSECLS